MTCLCFFAGESLDVPLAVLPVCIAGESFDVPLLLRWRVLRRASSCLTCSWWVPGVRVGSLFAVRCGRWCFRAFSSASGVRCYMGAVRVPWNLLPPFSWLVSISLGAVRAFRSLLPPLVVAVTSYMRPFLCDGISFDVVTSRAMYVPAYSRCNILPRLWFSPTQGAVRVLWNLLPPFFRGCNILVW